MKTYPVVIRFGGPTSHGHIVEQTAAQLGLTEAKLDWYALAKANPVKDDWFNYEQNALRRVRLNGQS